MRAPGLDVEILAVLRSLNAPASLPRILYYLRQKAGMESLDEKAVETSLRKLITDRDRNGVLKGKRGDLILYGLEEMLRRNGPKQQIAGKTTAASDLKKQNEDDAYKNVESLSLRLASIPYSSHAKDYETAVRDIFAHLFQGELKDLKLQTETSERSLRRDITAVICGKHSFFRRLTEDFNSRYVIIECKNHKDPLKPGEINDAQKYFHSAAHQNTLIIVSRKGVNQNAEKRIAGELRSGRLILSLNDDDLTRMLRMKADGLSPAEYLEEKLNHMELSVEK